MKLIKVAAAVLNQTPSGLGRQPPEHPRRHCDAPRRRSVGVLCLPELCISGYGCEDAFHSPGLQRDGAAGARRDSSRRRAGWSSRSACRSSHHNALFNAACLAVDGRIARLRRPSGTWPARACTTSRAGSSRGRGRAREMSGLRRADVSDRRPLLRLRRRSRIGFEICEDAWVATGPAATWRARASTSSSTRAPATSPSASSRSASGSSSRARGRSASATSTATCSGNEAGRAIYDGGALIASGGKLLAAGPRFVFRRLACDHGRGRRRRHAHDAGPDRQLRARPRRATPRREDSRPVPLARRRARARRAAVRPRGRRGAHLKEEEFARADRARRCSTTCGRAARAGSSCRSAAAPIRRPWPAWSR